MAKKNNSLRTLLRCLVVAGIVNITVLGFIGNHVLGVINPKFTPKDLVSGSGTIVVGVLKAGTDGDEWSVAEAKAFKGDSIESIAISLKQCEKNDLDAVRKLFSSNGKSSVIFFAGTFEEDSKAFLHVDGHWLSAKSAGKGHWDIEGFNLAMGGTLAGGTDMLIRMTRHIMAHPDDLVAPTSVNVKWKKHVKLGTINGNVSGMAVVQLKHEKTNCLFVASAAGDKLFRPKKGDGSFDDVTAEVKLDSKSQQFVWIDINGDGLADLVTWDGKGITVRIQTPAGTFEAADPAKAFSFDEECVGLAVCSAEGNPGLIVSTPSVPFSLKWDGNKWKRVDLPSDKIVDDAQGIASSCIVADLDNDGYVDVLQPRDTYGILWKGKADGFAAPVKSAVKSGGGPARFTLGDFDTDGFLDIFISGQQQSDLWENNGKGEFRSVKTRAGSLNSKAPPGASDCITADLNHDGRPDICVLYSNEKGFNYHFNRGFRCMGEEGELKLDGIANPQVQEPVGLQAGVVADFNDDGSQDFAVALTNGDLYCFYNDSFDNSGLRICLKKGSVGPVTASLWQDGESPVCYGTMVVSGYTPGTYFAVPNAGEYTIRWSEPGKAVRSERVIIENGTVSVVLAETLQILKTQNNAGNEIDHGSSATAGDHLELIQLNEKK